MDTDRAPRKGTARRCTVCNVPTAHYTGTRRAGVVSLRMWTATEAGDTRVGTETRCREHGPRS